MLLLSPAVPLTPPLGIPFQAGSSGATGFPPDMLVLTVGLALASLAPVAAAAVLALEGKLIDADEPAPATDEAPVAERTTGTERTSMTTDGSAERDRTIAGRSERADR